jgi:hypothetical protein
MPTTLILPHADRTLTPYAMRPAPTYTTAPGAFQQRVAFAAVHVVQDHLADTTPNSPPHLDLEATINYRHYLWSLGFSVAEAMDTAQRGMGLDWPTAQELITRSIAAARSCGGTVACGAGTDHLAVRPGLTLADVKQAYSEQVSFVEGQGGQIILMASRALAATATGLDDYAEVYAHILGQVSRPVIIHWLGDMFDPALAGYWGSRDLDVAMDNCLAVINAHAAKIDGIKISLLDASREISMRRRLPAHVKMYTGDDFNFAELIRGDDHGYSHALLGIFDAIAPVASAALYALDNGNEAQYRALLDPTVPLSRHIFQRPTFYYKTGVVFLAYLNGHQRHFRMLGGQESARSIVHLAELFRLADQAGVFADPAFAAARMRPVLQLAGIE